MPFTRQTYYPFFFCEFPEGGGATCRPCRTQPCSPCAALWLQNTDRRAEGLYATYKPSAATNTTPNPIHAECTNYRDPKPHTNTAPQPTPLPFLPTECTNSSVPCAAAPAVQGHLFSAAADTKEVPSKHSIARSATDMDTTRGGGQTASGAGEGPPRCEYCAKGCSGKHLKHERRDPACKLHGVPPRKVAGMIQAERGQSSASKPDTMAAVEPQPTAERRGTRQRCSSSSEEPESDTSTTSEEDDPLRRNAQKRQFCRRLVRSLYRGDWANLLFDKRSHRLYVEEEAPVAGECLRLTAAQTRKMVSQLMECAYYSLMCLHLYGEEARTRTLQQRLRESPLLATDVWTACRVRYHGQLGVTKQEVQALLDGRLTPLPEVTTAGDYVHEIAATPDDGGTSTTAPEEHSTTRLEVARHEGDARTQEKNENRGENSAGTADTEEALVAADAGGTCTPLEETNFAGGVGTNKADYDPQGKDPGSAIAKEELPDWTDPAGDVAPVTPPSSPFQATGAGEARLT